MDLDAVAQPVSTSSAATDTATHSVRSVFMCILRPSFFSVSTVAATSSSPSSKVFYRPLEIFAGSDRTVIERLVFKIQEAFAYRHQRVEEMINYFDYSYAVPAQGEAPFRVTTEMGSTPWNGGTQLMQIGVQGYAPQFNEKTARNLVFLLDVSGSMDAPNKLELVKKSLRLLVNLLSQLDRVAIVVYAGASGLVLPATSGDQHGVILNALERLHAGGSTNGGAGIQLAYAIAQQNYIEGGVNRVILATDGDFNVGSSSNAELKELIKEKKRSGVALTVLGFGTGNYNDSMLEEISNSGDGNAAHIDTLQEAQKVLVNDINATLQTIAYDTKIQVEFNPKQVASYRLIGYENRLLRREDFKNDRVDAGEIGAGHTVTALYEVTLNDSLHYQANDSSNTPFGHELAFVKIRYKPAQTSQSKELVQPILASDIRSTLANNSDNFRFAAAVAAFGQRLRNGQDIGDYSYDELLSLAQASRGEDKLGYRAEFLKLVGLAKSLR